uniref:Uncharacterized protein n=1 Tax=Anopheles farauti TaxID=69004 RepID=A0A182QGS3_9DIPT
MTLLPAAGDGTGDGLSCVPGRGVVDFSFRLEGRDVGAGWTVVAVFAFVPCAAPPALPAWLARWFSRKRLAGWYGGADDPPPPPSPFSWGDSFRCGPAAPRSGLSLRGAVGSGYEPGAAPAAPGPEVCDWDDRGLAVTARPPPEGCRGPPPTYPPPPGGGGPTPPR